MCQRQRVRTRSGGGGQKSPMGYYPSLKRGDDAANAGAPCQSGSEGGIIESPRPVPDRSRKRARVRFCSHRDLPGSWRCFLSALMQTPPLFFPLGGVLSAHALSQTLPKSARSSNTWAQANWIDANQFSAFLERRVRRLRRLVSPADRPLHHPSPHRMRLAVGILFPGGFAA